MHCIPLIGLYNTPYNDVESVGGVFYFLVLGISRYFGGFHGGNVPLLFMQPEVGWSPSCALAPYDFRLALNVLTYTTGIVMNICIGSVTAYIFDNCNWQLRGHIKPCHPFLVI